MRCAGLPQVERSRETMRTLRAFDVAEAGGIPFDADQLAALEIAEMRQRGEEKNQETPAESQAAEAKQDEGQDEAVVRRFKF